MDRLHAIGIRFTPETAVLLLLLLGTVLLGCRAWKMQARAAGYRKLALTDPQTGLGSRYAYELLAEQYRNGPVPENLCLVFLDMDGLKAVNASFGHRAGDEMIADTGRCIREAFGEGTCFRIGGDEFLAVLTADAQTVEATLDRFDRLIAQWNETHGGGLSLSRGVAAAGENPGMTFDRLLDTADRRMYCHKKQGSF